MFNLFRKHKQVANPDTASGLSESMQTKEIDKLPQSPALSRLMKATIVSGTLLLLVAIATSGYLYKQVTDLKNNPTNVAADQSKKIIDAVGKHMVLPTGEQPNLATVTDPSKLADQPFFANAKIGDTVLVYANAKMAIMYDPSIDKIVAVAPIGETSSPVSGASTAAKK